MELFGSIDNFDANVAEQIALPGANQQALMKMANFHLSRGFVFKQHGNLHLHAACFHKKKQVVEFLVKKGADIHYQNDLGHTALNIGILPFGSRTSAETIQVCKLVDVLVRLGASLSSKDHRGGTILHQWAFDTRFAFASGTYHQAVLGRLLLHDVPTDIVDDWGNTALMRAAAHRSVRFMMLLKATATHPDTNLDQQNALGQTCAHLLVSQSEDMKLNCHGVDDAQYANALKKLLWYGISLHVADCDGNTVTHTIVSERGNNDALRKVLYDHTHECMLAFLMGTHARLGTSNGMKTLDDIALNLILTDTHALVDCIALNSIYGTDTVQFQNSLAPIAGEQF